MGSLSLPCPRLAPILLINKTSNKEIDVVTKDGTFTFYGVVDVQQRIKELQAAWVEALNSNEEDRSNALATPRQHRCAKDGQKWKGVSFAVGWLWHCMEWG